MQSFDPILGSLSDLEQRTLLVSASAGSGKTWTIAHLACRWLLEDPTSDPSQVLMVTFSRAAAAELKTRLRGRMVEIETMLRSGRLDEGADEWLRNLHEASDETRQHVVDRIRAILPRLDDVSARTIHSFAAVFGESSTEKTDATTLREQAVREVLTRAGLEDNNIILDLLRDKQFSLSTLSERLSAAIAKSASLGGLWSDGRSSKARATKVTNELVEASVGPTGDGAEERILRVLEEIQHRIRDLEQTAGTSTFDSLISDLYAEISHAETPRRAQLLHDLRDRYRFVLIDEFQDTDAAQWEIFRTAFDGYVSLVMVGDPKQAIYGFRGGDVAIFEALLREEHDHYLSASLTKNFRSTPKLLEQLNGLCLAGEEKRDRYWEGTDSESKTTRFWAFSTESARLSTLESDPVGYKPVVSGKGGVSTATSGLHIRDLTTAHRLRGREDTPALIQRDSEEQLKKDDYLDEVFEDVVNVLRWRSTHEKFSWDQVAILARKNDVLEKLAKYLIRKKIPAALASSSSVFESQAATELRTLLWVLAEPTDVRRSRVLDLEYSWFRSLDFGDLEELADRLRLEGGAALARIVIASASILPNFPDDEPHRSWTDLEQLFDLLTSEFPRGVAAEQAMRWLDRCRIEKADADDTSSSRRIERGGGAVTLMTIHSSKGLEFPIVLIPQITTGEQSFRPKILASSSAGGINIDLTSLVQPSLEGAPEIEARVGLQTSDEAARMMYVALTRAKNEVWAWVTDGDRHELSDKTLSGIRGVNLWRMLLESNTLLSDRDKVMIAERAAKAGASVDIDIFDGSDYKSLARAVKLEELSDSEERSDSTLTPAPEIFYRQQQWSYSGLGLHGTLAPLEEVVEPEDGAGLGGTDEQEDEEDEVLLRARARLFGGHAGKDVGVAVHAVLEGLVGRASEADVDSIAAWIATGFRTNGFPDIDAQALVPEFQRILAAPLGSVFEGRSLGSFAGQRTMVSSEMRFSLPLHAREAQSRDVLLRILDSVVEDDPTNRYHAFFEQLRDVTAPVAGRLLSGFLEGSLDLTVQLGQETPRFAVMDYKTNTITDPMGYTTGPLDRVMQHAAYPLQALFYSVALHRFLAKRLAGYDPAVHLAGVSYFFLRAVADADGVGDGIVDFSFAPGALSAISLMLDGGA